MLDKLSDFDFELPPEAIAQKPSVPREAAKLLYPHAGKFQDHIIADLPELLQSADLLIVNNTRVIPAQLTGRKGEGVFGLPCINVWGQIAGRPLPNREKMYTRQYD